MPHIHGRTQTPKETLQAQKNLTQLGSQAKSDRMVKLRVESVEGAGPGSGGLFTARLERVKGASTELKHLDTVY